MSTTRKRINFSLSNIEVKVLWSFKQIVVVCMTVSDVEVERGRDVFSILIFRSKYSAVSFIMIV